MKWRHIPLVYLTGVILVGSPGCSPGVEPPAGSTGGAGPGRRQPGATAQARSQAGGNAQRARLAGAVAIGENRWQILEDTPPPATAEDLAADDDGDGGGGGGGGRHHPGGQRKKRFGQSPVYVDGVAVAVAAYGELPAWLPSRWIQRSDGRRVLRFVLADYLAALGVPLDRIQAVHLHGGRGRVGILTGDELRRVSRDLLFSFTQGEQGKMRMHWSGDIRISDSIDKVQAVAVYIDRAPPRWDRALWSLVDERGVPFEDIPYAEEKINGGVRMYLDGRIGHVFKRNRAFDQKLEPTRMQDGAPVFPLFDYLAEVGVDIKSVAALELLDENHVALRLDGRALAKERAAIEISSPPQSSGRLLVHLGPPDARKAHVVTAMNLYTPKRSRAHERR